MIINLLSNDTKDNSLFLVKVSFTCASQKIYRIFFEIDHSNTKDHYVSY